MASSDNIPGHGNYTTRNLFQQLDVTDDQGLIYNGGKELDTNLEIIPYINSLAMPLNLP